ncbi:hypothetical protein Fmac_000382 [Flemingia macrophylla]|uniref:Uncharacterized protein n=1 Tax=Flemingia macrophylla TaxID=520843 RepID=A0ABD1NFE0_9FABA
MHAVAEDSEQLQKMKTNVRPWLQHRKPSKTVSHEKAEMRGSSRGGANNAVKGGKASSKDRKLALQQDVDRLKKKLRHEENIHRALDRAFNRPLGALPRLPPYLPPCILGLLAEVAVLEEEIVKLEEQVVHFRQNLYQEAVYLSSSKMKLEHSAGVNNSIPNSNPKLGNVKSLAQTMENGATSETRHITTLPKDRHGKENQSCTNSSKSSKQSICKGQTAKSSIKKLPVDNKSQQKFWDHPKKQQVLRLNHQPISEIRNHCLHEKRGDESPNIISENILKCLSSILLRMSDAKNLDSTNDVPPTWTRKSEIRVEDPYGICLEFGKRNIGPFKHLRAIEAKSFDPKRTAKSLFLLHRLKLLFGKLACVNFENLNHQEKLAFWINIYNSCMINAYIENGIPESPEMVVALMQKAIINVGGHLLSATTIEHCILRLPYHWKFTLSKGGKNHETYGLELSEPLVTFALSCGTWSSPAVRVYTASQVENELEMAKREYLQAAVGISTSKFVIPKLLDWYLLDFAKDLEALLDWICLQLPSDVGKEAIKFLEKRKTDALSQFVQIMPYEFNFRYLMCT